MALAQVVYTADGLTDTWAFSFSYLDDEHVKVYVDGVEDVSRTLPTASSVQTSTTPTSGQQVLIQRVTPRASLVYAVPTSGSLRSVDLNNQAFQALYVAAEALDASENTLQLDPLTLAFYDADSKPIQNLTDPTNAQDAATKNYVDTAPLTAAATALAAAAAAEASAAEAATFDPANFVLKAGGTFTGVVDFNANVDANAGLDVTGGLLTLAGSSGEDYTRITFSRDGTLNAWVGVPQWDDDALLIYGPNIGNTASEQAAIYTQQSWTFRTGGSNAFTLNAAKNGTLVGDLTVQGGDIDLGVQGSQAGTLELFGAVGFGGTVKIHQGSTETAAGAGGAFFTLACDNGEFLIRGDVNEQYFGVNADGDIKLPQYGGGPMISSSLGVLSAGAWVEHADGEVDVDASQTSGVYTWTGIPSWVTEIKLTWVTCSPDAASNLLYFRVGDSGGLDNTGYQSQSYNYTANSTTRSNGFVANAATVGAAAAVSGCLVLKKGTGNRWYCQGFNLRNSVPDFFAGEVLMGGTLDRVAIFWNAGANFDGSSFATLFYR